MSEWQVDFEKVAGKIGGKKGLWVNRKYELDGEPASSEFFIKKTEAGFKVGFDDYFDKYEDAVDLYFVYLRANFSELKRAVEFALREGFVGVDELMG
ncbi:hypothetical protein MRS60_02055 [Burkholderia pyrrocinia]|uniref:hypothetical protein n=1 Tax=Burkholderia pyrrocinia TaxID=60550 RepID=UPI001FB52383|nr:hypothetical protein [Burkholderia pyrrocinia]UOB55911.1 hypothetical protein MRS60_02055 [Burkholderia pyrrocinia]